MATRDAGTPDRREHGAPAVVITGASGLIGTRIARALSSHYAVVGLDVNEPGEDYPDRARFIECDLTDDHSTAAAVDQVREACGLSVASIIHLAAYYDFAGEPSPLYDELTVAGTRRLLRCARQRLDVGQFVFSSSLLVMEPNPDKVLDEGDPVRAEWDYPRSKLEAERVLRENHGDVPTVVLRLAGAYDEKGHSPPITQQIWRIREKKLESFLFPGNRSHGQSFIHLDDVESCFTAVVERRSRLGTFEIYLVGEPEVVSYGELQDRIGELLHGRAWPTLRIPAPVAKAGAWVKDTIAAEDEQFIKPWMVDLADAHYEISIERARHHLGWAPEKRLIAVLPAMIDELRRDPRAWYEENDLPLDDEAADAPRQGASAAGRR